MKLRKTIRLSDFDYVKPKKTNIFLRALICSLATFIVAFPIGLYVYRRDSNVKNAQAEVQQKDAEVKGLSNEKCNVETPLSKYRNWWDLNYKYRQEVLLTKYIGFDEEKSITITIAHAALVSTGKSKVDGSDIHVIANDDGKNINIPISKINLNTQTAEIKFNPGKFTNFHIYYGRDAQEENRNANITNNNDYTSYTYEIKSTVQRPMIARLDRSWALIGYSTNDFHVYAQVDEGLRSDSLAINYLVVDSDVEGALLTNQTEYVANVTTENLKEGRHKIKVVISDECNKIESNTLEFNLSYPLFVSWSMDWEGYTVSGNIMKRIDNLADKYGIKLTQFFNPRIYITNSIRQEDKDAMTDFAKMRLTKGDEIGLHLHMWNDMVRAAGVVPKNSITWANEGSGYDTLFSSYNYDESYKLLKWGKTQLEAKGFKDIISFRAGGWEINTENYRALEALGFKVDSSGRTRHNLGTNLVRSQWNLAPTTKPYLPSRTDLNTTGSDSFKVWQFPNNGSDSYTYSYVQMKERFDQNYSNYLASPQVITYLSHPHWFDIDEPKLLELFAYISQYSYTQDKGNVVFVPLKTAHSYWTTVNTSVR